jgi:hypothetical protein
MAKLPAALVLAALISAVAGCKKEESPPPPGSAAPAPAPQAQTPPPTSAAVSVANISLGKQLAPDKKVAAATDTFSKSDTIYAVVETTGSGNATLKAKWTYQKGDTTVPVSEDSKTINATGPAVSEFHVSKPDGWPAGSYRVEISLNDQSAGTKQFMVN